MHGLRDSTGPAGRSGKLHIIGRWVALLYTGCGSKVCSLGLANNTREFFRRTSHASFMCQHSTVLRGEKGWGTSAAVAAAEHVNAATYEG
jgi:hypothetical protein